MRARVIAFGLALVALSAALPVAFAQVSQPGTAQPAPALYVYATKFLCGEFDKFKDPRPPQVIEGPVKPGNYQTVINVHNPHFTSVGFQKKAVLLFWGDKSQQATEHEVPKPPYPLHSVALKSDWGMYIDCQDIRNVLLKKTTTLPGAPPAPTFIEGWVVFYSQMLIDVEAVYTSHSFNMTSTGMLEREGWDTEMRRIEPTRVSAGHPTVTSVSVDADDRP